MDKQSLYSPQWAFVDDAIAFAAAFPNFKRLTQPQLRALLSICLDHHAWNCAKIPIEHGFDVNRNDEIDSSILVQRISVRDNESVRWLLENGADVNSPRQVSRGFPIHFAVYCGNCAAIPILKEFGANLNAVDGSGQTPLWSAVFLESHQAIDALLSAGADPGIIGPQNKSLLEHAKDNDLADIQQILDKHGIRLERGTG